MQPISQSPVPNANVVGQDFNAYPVTEPQLGQSTIHEAWSSYNGVMTRDPHRDFTNWERVDNGIQPRPGTAKQDEPKQELRAPVNIGVYVAGQEGAVPAAAERQPSAQGLREVPILTERDPWAAAA